MSASSQSVFIKDSFVSFCSERRFELEVFRHTLELLRQADCQFVSTFDHENVEMKTHVVVDNVVCLEARSPGIVVADSVEPTVLVDDRDDL